MCPPAGPRMRGPELLNTYAKSASPSLVVDAVA